MTCRSEKAGRGHGWRPNAEREALEQQQRSRWEEKTRQSRRLRLKGDEDGGLGTREKPEGGVLGSGREGQISDGGCWDLALGSWGLGVHGCSQLEAWRPVSLRQV